MILRHLWVALAVIFLCGSGCVVYSVGPFHLQESGVDVPEAILGEWRPLRLEGVDATGKGIGPWRFDESQVLIYDKNGLAGELKLSFFEIGGRLFCDSSPSTIEEGTLNDIQTYHLWPLHLVTRVSMRGDSLIFLPLDYDWVAGAVKKGDADLSSVVRQPDDFLLFTASPGQWENFLRAHGSNPQMFDEGLEFVCIRANVQGAREE